MRVKRPDDHLGHLIPPGALTPDQIRDSLTRAMLQRRYLAGHGVPSAPTRYVVAMAPSDRVWLDPRTEDDCARALTRYAERNGLLIVGAIEVEFEADPGAEPGHPRIWAGFREDDLLVLAGPKAALEVFAAPR